MDTCFSDEEGDVTGLRARRKLPRLGMFGFVGAVCLGIVSSKAAAGSLLPSPELSTAAQVRALAPQEAGKSLPVKLRGVVMGEADPEGVAFVVQDETDGIYVQGPPEAVARIRRGDVVAIEGLTDPGGFAPYVVARTVEKVGEQPIPDPISVTLDELQAGQMDAKWVEIQGIVRSVEPKTASDTARPPPGTRYSVPAGEPTGRKTAKVKMKVASAGSSVVVEVSGDFPPEDYVDAAVRLSGLCFNLHNRNRQFVRPFVQVPRGLGVDIRVPPPRAPFSSEPRSVASLLSFDQLLGKQGHRVHVRGVIIHHEPGQALWVRDQDRSLRVDTHQPGELKPGDEVDVLGFPALGNYSAVLEDAVFRKIGTGSPPVPQVLGDLSEALLRDADLVELVARLTEVRRVADTVLLSLDWGENAVRAQVRSPENEGLPSDWLPGSVVKISGVCSVVTDGVGPLGGLWEPQSFQLLLRTPEDLAVVQPPAWWSTQRVIWVLSGFLLLAVSGAGLVMLASKRRLKDQEHRREMAETEFAAILNERNRVAREIHDTLAQSLGAISVQLENARTHATEFSPAARSHLATAHKLARAALAEARESIWNMRSQVLEKVDLGEALAKLLQQMTEEARIAADVRVEGERRRLPPVVENNLLRIGQEAITNACKHAQPKHIHVVLTYEGRRIELAVTDDGIGFDPTTDQATDRRSFGLVGMRERAELLGGTFEIASAPGQGTRLKVSVSV